MTNTEKKLSEGPYKVYDLMTNEFLGGYVNDVSAMIAHKGQPITVIYRPGRKKVKK